MHSNGAAATGAGAVREKEARVRAMYSQLRYPALDPEANALYARHRRYIYRRLGMDPDRFFRGKVVLDAGCGTGEETLFLAGLGAEKVIGIDTSEGSIKYAREAAARAAIENVEFRLASVLDRRVFPDGSFDYVSSLGCIHHTPDTRGAFRNLARLVRPGGCLCTFIYNSFGHFFYNIECDLLDRWAGNDVEARVRLARRLFDWRSGKTFYREGVPSSSEARLYDKYGVLYRDSLSLKTLLSWYEDEGFAHRGSFPMYLRDILDALRARSADAGWPAGLKGWMGRGLYGLSKADAVQREWTWSRRFAMQALLFGLGMVDYGSAFRVLGVKKTD